MGGGQRKVWEKVKERCGKKSKRDVGEGQREVWEKVEERYGIRLKRGGHALPTS